MTAPTVPPSTVEALLAGLGANPAFRDAMLGDLAEELALRSARDGPAAALRWYRVEALRAAPHLLRRGLRGGSRGRARRLGYVVRAVAAAYGIVAALAAAVGALVGLGLRLAGVDPRLPHLPPPGSSGWWHWFETAPAGLPGPALGLVFALGAVGAVVGGDLAARFGRRAPLACALALGSAAAAVSLMMAVAAGPAWPAWYRAGAPVVALVGVTAGGALRALRDRARRTRAPGPPGGPPTPLASPRWQVAAFLALLVLVRGPFYIWALSRHWGHRTDVPLWAVIPVLLSAPPTFAVAVRWRALGSLRRALGSFGWRPGPWRYLVAGWAAPVLVPLAVYAAAWAGGLVAPIPGRPLTAAALLRPTLAVTLGLVVPTLLGEELGWRGLLVPELARFLPFGRVALVSGAVWALFHYPFLLSPDTATVPPTVSSVAAFTAAVMAASFPLAWLRLRSGSVWPAVLFHAAHNAVVGAVLARAFRPTGALGAAVVGESGWGLALGYALLAGWAWRRRAALPLPAPEEPEEAPPPVDRASALRRVWQRTGQRAWGIRGVRLPDARPVLTQFLGAGLLVIGLGHLAYGLARQAAEVGAGAYLVLAAGAALGGWLVGRGGERPAARRS